MADRLSSAGAVKGLDPTRVAVIVGVGEVNDRPASAASGRDSAELMAAALDAADADAGGGWIARCDRLLVVPQISFRQLDVAASLAKATGLPAERISLAPQASGDTPIRLLDDAANAIRAGEATVVAITGGEALRTAAARAREAGGETSLFSGSKAKAKAAPLRHRYGLITPSEIYPLYENALRAELGQTLAEGQTETGRIWSLMSEVAATSAGAWLKTPRTAEEIIEPTVDNRPIAFPYTKLTVANASVNQGSAVIVTSLAAALAAGVAQDRLVYVGAGAAAHEPDDPLERAGWTTSPSMRVSIGQAMARNGLATDDLDMVELYSCFPCVPKMARRALGWPQDRSVTVHGGLTFGGGPIGDYMGHAVAAMVRKLREGAQRGLLFANGGYCSHNHSLVLSRTPARFESPQNYDVQAQADAHRGHVPTLTDEVEGLFPVETYTLIYDRAGAVAYGVVLSLTPSRERVIARVAPEDSASIAYLTSGRIEPVGRPGRNQRRDGQMIWSVAS